MKQGCMDTRRLPVRGIYFATHFGNWYVNAPVESVCAYIRELAARGTNHLMLWLDTSNCYSPDAPETEALVGRLRRFIDAARDAGMRVGLVRVANEAWRNSPPEWRANPAGGRGAIMLSDLCPSHAGARDLIARTSSEVFGLFEHLDFLCLWPYDSGGCGCDGCRPWGGNGFLASAGIVARVFRERFPQGQIILSTWLMDPDEWRAIRAQLESDRLPWVDALMAELFRGEYPPDLLRGEVPRNLPLLGFPEISMEGMTPWGGCGANPRPGAIEKRWHTFGRHLSGGFPYSEGIFEDVNKAVYAGLYDAPDRAVDDILRDYAAREFSPGVAEDTVEMLRLMETTLPRQGLSAKCLDNARRVEDLACSIESRLRHEVAAGWRWRVLRIRARIDALLQEHKGAVTPELKAQLAELHAVYHTDESSLLGWLLPPLPPRRTSPEPRNLAAGRRVTVSSVHALHPGCDTALVDDVVSAFDPENAWCSAAGDLAPSIMIDLGGETSLAEIGLQFRGMPGRNGWYVYRCIPGRVTVDIARGDGVFETVIRESRDVPVEGQLYKQWFYRYPVGRRGRYVRIAFTPSTCKEPPYAGCVQLSEIRVYGAER